MNKNNQNYKETFAAFNPSDTAVEKIFEMTTDNRKSAKGITFKRVAAVVLAFVLVISGGFGVNAVIGKKTQSYDKLGVMVAMAGERELLSAGSINEQQLFYRIYVADMDDKEQWNRIKTEWGNEKAEQLEKASELGEKNITAGVGSGGSGCYSSEQDRETAMLYTLRAGEFVLTLNDYSNVKSITIENSSEYGNVNLQLDVEGEDLSVYNRHGHCVSATGEEIRYSIEQGFYETHTQNGTVNKGYCVQWEASHDLYDTIGNDVNFDLSQIKDTIIFMVRYDDGSSEQASVNLAFDRDGYMHITDTE